MDVYPFLCLYCARGQDGTTKQAIAIRRITITAPTPAQTPDIRGMGKALHTLLPLQVSVLTLHISLFPAVMLERQSPDEILTSNVQLMVTYSPLEQVAWVCRVLKQRLRHSHDSEPHSTPSSQTTAADLVLVLLKARALVYPIRRHTESAACWLNLVLHTLPHVELMSISNVPDEG